MLFIDDPVFTRFMEMQSSKAKSWYHFAYGFLQRKGLRWEYFIYDK